MSYQEIASAVERIDRAVAEMRQAGLHERVVVLLLTEMTRLSPKTVRQVLAAQARLADYALTEDRMRAIRLRDSVGGGIEEP